MSSRALLRSSVGRKAMVAVTGLLLVGFVVLHLAGNLLIYGGPDAINAYAKKLSELGPLLWGARAALLATVLVHLWTSIQLAIESRRARPQGYRKPQSRETTLAARTMALSGLLLLACIVYHLLHFTFRVTPPSLSHLTDALGRHDVYAMMVLSFQHAPIALGYVLAMGLLALHLDHGVASVFQTLGWADDRSLPRLGLASRVIALLVFVGYSSIPLAVLFGWLR